MNWSLNHGMDITKLPSNFRIEWKTMVIIQFKTQWDLDMQNIETYPILRTYNRLNVRWVLNRIYTCWKNHKNIEWPWLSKKTFRIFLQLGVINIQDQKSKSVIEPAMFVETHVLFHCPLHKREWEVLFSNALKFNPGFSDMSDVYWATQINKY